MAVRNKASTDIPNWENALVSHVDAELFQFLGIVTLVEEVPLFRTLANVALLGANFGARGSIDLFFRLKLVRHHLYHLEANIVHIALEPEFAALAQRGNDFVRDI